MKGKWTKGQSGNPAGKKPGTGHVQKLRQGLEKSLPEVLAALVEQAKGGDIGAIRLLLDRTIPALRPTDAPAPIALGSSPLDACKAIMAAIETGELTPMQASTLSQAIGTAARVEEIQELKARLEAIEAALIKR